LHLVSLVFATQETNFESFIVISRYPTLPSSHTHTHSLSLSHARALSAFLSLSLSFSLSFFVSQRDEVGLALEFNKKLSRSVPLILARRDGLGTVAFTAPSQHVAFTRPAQPHILSLTGLDCHFLTHVETQTLETKLDSLANVMGVPTKQAYLKRSTHKA